MSRLDRLFVLLESGSTPGTRRAAAEQLGEVQRLHPHELPFILSRVHKCLRSPSWETRVAAGLAVEAILAKIPPWKAVKKEEIKQERDECGALVIEDGKRDVPKDPATPVTKKERLTFCTFDLSILSNPQNCLMASDTKVFDNSNTPGGSSLGPLRNEDPSAQRALINRRLGLDVAEKMGIDTSDIVSNEDLLQQDDPITPSPGPGHCYGYGGESSFFDPNLEASLSSREMNLAKRRARKAKLREQQSLEQVSNGTNGSQDGKRLKREESIPGDFTESSIYSVPEGVWPLSAWVEVLVNDLFSPAWEIRHGAATGLREVLKLHGVEGGRAPGMGKEEGNDAHSAWIEDLALRLLSVLALDRFGDFVSDQVVAPVRETCSQVLGTAVALMEEPKVLDTVQILIQLLARTEWEVRHGALLGLKYIFAVRRDLVSSVLPLSFPTIFACLSDSVDDVCSVAASALIPTADLLISNLPETIPKVLGVLWEGLSHLDDLSSACNSIMGLLATLLTFPEARTTLKELDILIPRLWPFLHHTSSSVRRSALLTLQKLTDLDPTSGVTPLSVKPLQETLRHLFQRALVENIREVAELIPGVWCDLLRSSPLEALLLAACPCFGTWLCLAMHPPRTAVDPNCLIPVGTRIGEKVFLGGGGDVGPTLVAATRLRLTRMLGQLAAYIVQPLPNGVCGEDPIELFVRVLMVHLNSRSALQRTTTAFVVSSWPDEPEGTLKDRFTSSSNGAVVKKESAEGSKGAGKKAHPGLCKRLNECLTESVYFDEVALSFTKLQSECKDFLATLRHYKIPVPPEVDECPGGGLFSPRQMELLGAEAMVEMISKTLKRPKITDSLLERRKSIFNLWNQTTADFQALNLMTLAALSSAVVSVGDACLPVKLNPVVKPLMDAVKREENAEFQARAAQALTLLINLAIVRDPSPNGKIISNLVTYLTADRPELLGKSNGSSCGQNEEEPILSLITLNPGSEGGKNKAKEDEGSEASEALRLIEIGRRGARLALTHMTMFFGSHLKEKVPRLWEVTFGVLLQDQGSEGVKDLESIVKALLVLEVISPSLHRDLYPVLESEVGRLCDLLTEASRGVRHMAARVLAVWASLMPEKVMPLIATQILPLLDIGGCDSSRQGGLEAVWCVVDKLGLDLLPYIVLLVLPVLGRMSDQNPSVRMLASLTFAHLVRLMPLEGGVPDPPNLPLALAQQKGAEREFLDQLLNPSRIPKYEVKIEIKAELRGYQQAGINWLGFLNRFRLHGVLADDMGLGKTIQSIAVLAQDHQNALEKYNKEKVPELEPLPSIVICPPTLTGHWVYEVEKFVDADFLDPLHYHGPPAERNRLKPKVKNHNLVIASYDIVRNDIDFFSGIRWNYCILDEGHIIKNGKTKISRAIKELKSQHRLILSGTPIQNNVLELWSLFDFLMPGFLGTEKQFSARFARPILLARDPKASPKDQEAGALAMEALHRQALPFLLRRLKEDVLQDLPPKITQDYYCELSPIQETLYEDFARTRAHQSLRDTFGSGLPDDPTKHSHIFQALQYLRKVCNHPKLVLTPQHPKFLEIMGSLKDQRSSLADISHSAKLPALKQLLLDCGIGVTSDGSSGGESFSVVGQHRALIFCQLKVMLDILENDLLKVHLPSVTYLRLDGGVPAGARHSLVTRFNNDPSIDVLLLTTQVGGLGLNLTGADTVIFVEHDWNPMRDLQAMDRAHRIGQKKVVNVYRLITRGTLEEKIMGLQKFKLMTANTVISQENAGMETMATDQLLDLFVLEDSSKEDHQRGKKEDVGGIVGAYKNVLENLPELWEDKLYEEEYDLSTFIRNLAK